MHWNTGPFTLSNEEPPHFTTLATELRQEDSGLVRNETFAEIPYSQNQDQARRKETSEEEKPEDHTLELSFGGLLRCGQETAPPETESGDLDCACVFEIMWMFEANKVAKLWWLLGKGYLRCVLMFP